MTLRVGVLDQSPVVGSATPARAIAESIALARLAERLGFHRYWLAEHHALSAFADPCPEILACRIAGETSTIRVGTGGVLLPNYSALKVAEVFRMLEALFPGRIDLGIGRAPGGSRLTAQALSYDPHVAENLFPGQVADLIGFLDHALPAGHPYAGVKAQPQGPGSPEVWLLGSSDYSGALAAQLGLRFSFAQFINAYSGDAVMRAYRGAFVASERETKPVSMLAVFVICAETGEGAERLAAAIDLRRLLMARGVDAPFPTLEQADAHHYSDAERDHVRSQRAKLVLGDPDQVRVKLLALAEQHAADELMVITITGDYASRARSYELLAQALALRNRSSS
jgi:luciferase family oxidoreductase group 1